MDTLVRESPVGFPPERVTPLKPSEALVLGRLLRPRRLRDQMLDGDDGACALGAIATAAGFPPEDADGNWPGFTERWPEWSMTSVMDVAVKNDLGWSDDELVAYLESRGL